MSEPTTIDTSNRFRVTVRDLGTEQEHIVIKAFPMPVWLWPEDALNLAAWLVTLTPSGLNRFPAILKGGRYR